MAKVFITRKIPDMGIAMLRDKSFEVDVSTHDRPLTKVELIEALKIKPYDAVLTLLTDKIDSEVMDACPTAKIYANFAIGYNNFDIEEAKKRGIVMTNTPGGGADRVSEHTWSLILTLSTRTTEGDRYVRSGKYVGWDPMLLHGRRLQGLTLGVIGTGRIGAEVLSKGVRGFGMKAVYYDVKRNETLEKDCGAVFGATVEEVLSQSDVVSIHVPLLDSTKHLINETRLRLMKPDAYLVNTARGPIIDEQALVKVLQSGHLGGVGLDVFENEPALAPGLADIDRVVLTPHIASASIEARYDMAKMSADNIIEVLEGRPAKNPVN